MDYIQQMSDACEAMFVSTEHSRERYKEKLRKIEDKFNAKLMLYRQLGDMSTELTNQVIQIKDGKERKKAIQKGIRPIADFCYKNGIMDSDPVNQTKIYKRMLTSVLNRADRKHPEIKELVDDLTKSLSPGGALYKKAEEMQKYIQGTDYADKASARAEHTMMAQQQMLLLQQQMLQQEIMRQQQMLINQQVTQMHNSMMMGMM